MPHFPKYVGPEFTASPLQPIAAGKTGLPQRMHIHQELSDISLDTENTEIELPMDGEKMVCRLNDGDPFQRKTIVAVGYGDDDFGVIEVVGNFSGPKDGKPPSVPFSRASFNSNGDFLKIEFLAGAWRFIENNGVWVR
jgi:hypothetical protein